MKIRSAAIFSLIVMLLYAIQRGVGVMAKSGELEMDLALGLWWYFNSAALVVVFIGVFLDRIRTRMCLRVAAFAGFLSMAFMYYNHPIWFGVFFGIASCFFKLLVFTNPLKHGYSPYWIVPQAISKNVGAAIFLLVAAGLFVASRIGLLLVFIGGFFLLIMIFAPRFVEDNRIETWDFKYVKKMSKRLDFWILMSYFFLMGGTWWVVLSNFYPDMKAAGYSSSVTLYALVGFNLLSGLLRFPASWLGQRFGYNNVIWVALVLTFGVILVQGFFPLTMIFLFAIISSVHTPNYWPQIAETWDRRYMNTLAGVSYVFIYLGSGVLFKWI
jgi:hypothetical protein